MIHIPTLHLYTYIPLYLCMQYLGFRALVVLFTLLKSHPSSCRSGSRILGFACSFLIFGPFEVFLYPFGDTTFPNDPFGRGVGRLFYPYTPET